MLLIEQMIPFICIIFFSQDCQSLLKIAKNRRRRTRNREIRRANREGHQALIQLSQKAYALFVAWKGNWGKGRTFVESQTGALVKHYSIGGERFLVAGGDESTVERAIHMIVTQSLSGVASSDDYTILD